MSDYSERLREAHAPTIAAYNRIRGNPRPTSEATAEDFGVGPLAVVLPYRPDDEVPAYAYAVHPILLDDLIGEQGWRVGIDVDGRGPAIVLPPETAPEVIAQVLRGFVGVLDALMTNRLDWTEA